MHRFSFLREEEKTMPFKHSASDTSEAVYLCLCRPTCMQRQTVEPSTVQRPSPIDCFRTVGPPQLATVDTTTTTTRKVNMSPVRYVGRTTNFHGKRLYDILCRLKNFGVGRMVYRYSFNERYPQPSYYVITDVNPSMNDPTQVNQIQPFRHKTYFSVNGRFVTCTFPTKTFRTLRHFVPSVSYEY